MAERNQHGLGRYVPQSIKREIRRRCGFGCVICGLAYYDYEHFDPDFKDAKAHLAEGMTLLCMQCNQKRARGTLSALTVTRANANPKCKQLGFASELFDFGPDPIEVKIAGVSFTDCNVLLRVRGEDILSFKPPEEPGGPVLLSGCLTDVTGSTTLKIVDNVWSAGEDNWDVEVVGPRITIRRDVGDIALQVRVCPPHALAIEIIDMEVHGCFIRGGEEIFSYSFDGVDWASICGVSVAGYHVGIEIN
ncbi:hypothetical protein [Pseudomonas fragi]|uniref:hypothetical protein n=1 Tax=Pseudomonas fragi TaxID=296 RepID=UPI003918470D